jgi:hypothetical protein
MLTLTAALYHAARPSWLAYKRYLETKQYSLTIITYRWKDIQTLILVEWASSMSPQPPKPNKIFNRKQEPNTSFTHDMPRRPPNPCYAAGPQRPRSAGWPPPPNSKPSHRKLKSECPLTTNGKFKKTRNVHALSLSLFLFSQSSSDSPGQKVLEGTSLFPPSDELWAVHIDVQLRILMASFSANLKTFS